MWCKLALVTVALVCFNRSDSGVVYHYHPADFVLTNDGLTYRGELFTGALRDHNGNVVTLSRYVSGKLDGTVRGYFAGTNQIAKLLPHRHGVKVGVHRTYYESGARRSESTYVEGKYHGLAQQWYRSGRLYSLTKYQHGELVGHKLWRKNGRVFSNYVYRDGKKIGLEGGKLCFTTQDVKGM